jgi:hypothetical protein
MALNIETFSNTSGGQAFFKAIGHPLAVEKIQNLLGNLKAYSRLAIYDPHGYLGAFAELYDLVDLKVSSVYVQRYEALRDRVLGQQVHLVSELSSCDALFIVSFESSTKIPHIAHLLPADCPVYSLEEVRIPDHLLTNPQRYLDPLNFATNFAFFREEGSLHTRLTTANYWSGYTGRPSSLWCCLFDKEGKRLIDWVEKLPSPHSLVVIESREIRERFNLPEFCGQLFLHVIGAGGHDIVKYALDIFSDDGQTLSCTHDANAWPADLYAGLPAPQEDEEVILWVQNSHPCSIPLYSVGINVMGNKEIAWWSHSIPGFGSWPLNVRELLPSVKWPQQLEIQAGKYFVRPRYEILKRNLGKYHIAHANVQRTDLSPDPQLKQLSQHFGKGFILPAPLLSLDKWDTIVLPTPMATTQKTLPVAVEVYDKDGKKVARESWGLLSRSDSKVLNITSILKKKNISLKEGFGHIEVMYDFKEGGEADGWLHALFRYELQDGTHVAETSFGAHIFNTLITYKNQPLSYRGTPPGLSTRLFLRLGEREFDTHCHLIYPASTPWHSHSATEIQLFSKEGKLTSKNHLKIPCGGSSYWRVREMFSAQELKSAGESSYILIRDETCRLFGYHGLIDAQERFSLDHMFGF